MLRSIPFPNIKPHWHFDKILSENSARCLLSNLSNNLDNAWRMLNGPKLFFKARVRSGIFANVDQLGICFYLEIP